MTPELPPVARLLGASPRRLDLEKGELEVDYLADAGFANPAGAIQGGMLGAMLDDVTASLVTAALPAGERCATLNLNLSFLRPALPGPLSGHAQLERRGREIVFVSGRLLQDGKVVATAAATCTVVRGR